VATAQAYAFQDLLVQFTTCFTPDYSQVLLAGAYAKAEAFAQDVQVAINKVYAGKWTRCSSLSPSPSGCAII
jgi:hypothetical protein